MLEEKKEIENSAKIKSNVELCIKWKSRDTRSWEKVRLIAITFRLYKWYLCLFIKEIISDAAGVSDGGYKESWLGMNLKLLKVTLRLDYENISCYFQYYFNNII